MTASFTAETLAPQDLQNFKSSAWLVPHCGQNIQLPPALCGIRLLYPPGSGKCYEAALRKFYPGAQPCVEVSTCKHFLECGKSCSPREITDRQLTHFPTISKR